MKFIAIATALLGVQAAQISQDEQADDKLAQLISSALAGAPPGEIKERAAATGDKENERDVTEGHTKNYKFHWQYVCAFTKWTPTNQWLHNAEEKSKLGQTIKYDATKMTLERFGFIGESKQCYWGMTGVEWVTPLKVSQIKP